MRLFLLLLVMGIWSLGSIALAKGGSGGVGHRVELNGFYGMASVAPGDLNDLIDAINPAFSTKLSKITTTTLFGGEFLYSLNPSFQLGARYTSQSGTSGEGTASVGGVKWSFTPKADDASLVAKYNWTKNAWAFYIGATGGMTTSFKVAVKTGSTTNDYTASSNAFVARGLLGGRINLGVIGIFLEGGYQMLSASEFKYNNVKLTNGTKTVGVNLSGPYGLAGLGLQF